MPGVLMIVGTPLGNREDLSPRARAAIVGADLLLCEDTRSPNRLLG
ncbi:MAG: rRNA (cytidine-2'-O-)-methyltransferase, partial [Deltaproteobacteria bacterium]|nr:rRNA (cytidine-2'-O-)-methyltransferase [Nannocystaceae bacterium]